MTIQDATETLADKKTPIVMCTMHLKQQLRNTELFFSDMLNVHSVQYVAEVQAFIFISMSFTKLFGQILDKQPFYYLDEKTLQARCA